MKNFLKEKWFKISLLIVMTILTYVISVNISQNRKAEILMFCVKQYDERAVGASPNTWFGFPDQCLGRFNSLIK